MLAEYSSDNMGLMFMIFWGVLWCAQAQNIKKRKEEELMKKNDDLDLGWDFPEGMKFSGRSLDEICEAARENFYKANGYYPTVEEAVRLTDEAREEIKKEQESKK